MVKGGRTDERGLGGGRRGVWEMKRWKGVAKKRGIRNAPNVKVLRRSRPREKQKKVTLGQKVVKAVFCLGDGGQKTDANGQRNK